MSPQTACAIVCSRTGHHSRDCGVSTSSASTTSDSASDPNLLTNQCIIEMAAAKLPEEIIITKIQTTKTKFDLPTPALVERNTGGCPPMWTRESHL